MEQKEDEKREAAVDLVAKTLAEGLIKALLVKSLETVDKAYQKVEEETEKASAMTEVACLLLGCDEDAFVEDVEAKATEVTDALLGRRQEEAVEEAADE
ncbi:hypothetical protein GMI70_07075 [Eggerthellaceae bacterium zg-893]|nr:hypothetical protein [Eggerthellaceae bacterium zg-893]